MTTTDWRPTEYEIRAMTTEIIEIEGQPRTRFSRSALEDAARQVGEYFVPMNVEHLSCMPPLARWYEGEVVDCDDGQSELLLRGRELPHFLPVGNDADPLRLVGQLAPTEALHHVDAEFLIEPRNYDETTLSELIDTAPFEVSEHSQWSVLPPIELMIGIGVTWGAVQFAGAFFAELGRASASELVAWLKGWRVRAKKPNRDQLVTLRFELPDDALVYGFIPLQADAPDADETLLAALDSSGELASFSGLQRDESVLPDLKRAAFIFAAGSWHFAWWTDGQAVYRTRWFDINQPDPRRFLDQGNGGDDED